MAKKNPKLAKAEMFEDKLFQQMLNTALNTMYDYQLPSIRAVEVDDVLTNEFGEEKANWFYDTWDKI